MTRTTKPDPEATHIEPRNPLDKLADRYLDQLSNEDWGSPHSGFEPTLVNFERPSDTPTAFHPRAAHHSIGSRKDPILAAFISLIIPGAGFLYVGSYFLGTLFLLVLSATLLSFGSYSGLFPFIPNEFRFLPATFSTSEALVAACVFAGLFVWLNLILPVYLANRTRSLHPKPHPFWTFLTFPIPVIGLYVQRRFFWGGIQALGFVACGFLATVATLLWRQEGPVELLWLSSSSVAGLCIFMMILTSFVSFIGAMRVCGVIESGGSDTPTEKKFVVLGMAVVILLAGYGFAGPPGRLIQKQGIQITHVLEKRGFKETSSGLKGILNDWKHQSEQIASLTEILR